MADAGPPLVIGADATDEEPAEPAPPPPCATCGREVLEDGALVDGKAFCRKACFAKAVRLGIVGEQPGVGGELGDPV